MSFWGSHGNSLMLSLTVIFEISTKFEKEDHDLLRHPRKIYTQILCHLYLVLCHIILVGSSRSLSILFEGSSSNQKLITVVAPIR